MQQSLLYLVPGLAILGLVVMAVQAAWVRKQSTGEARMSEIAQHIHEGALAFLSAEYRILAVFVVIAGALLGLVSSMVETTHWFIVVAFVIGAVFSALARNIGMRIATQANVRTVVIPGKHPFEPHRAVEIARPGFGIIEMVHARRRQAVPWRAGGCFVLGPIERGAREAHSVFRGGGA